MMREKIKIHEAVIVEGRYDKIKLSNIIDAFILETDGFSIFKDKIKLTFIKKLALESCSYRFRPRRFYDSQSYLIRRA